MTKQKIARLFESRSARLEHRLKQDYVRNGIATIPCHISDYSDVINTYSVEGFEAPNTEFIDYVTTSAEVTLPECPIVLNIVGDCLSQSEKKTITETIRDYFAYQLGMVEKDEKRHTRTFALMMIGLVLSGILLWCTRSLEEEFRELFFILFWFVGDTLCDYIFLTGYDLRRSRRLAGRLASIKVVFSDSYVKPNYTESDVDRLYSEIEKDVNETIQEEE